MSAGAGNGDEPSLREMTAVQLRKFAKDEGLQITYLSQRPRPDLLEAIEKALSARESV